MKKLLRKMTVGWAGGLGLILVGLLLAGCQTAPERIPFTAVEGEEEMTGMGNPTSSDPVLVKGDTVKVTFSGLTEAIPPHEEQIKDDGTITLPLIGAVKADGKTAGELQKLIHDRYVPDYYRRITVIVTTDRQVYYVQGQVRSPGRQQYIGPTTVLKAIASASDFTDFANRKKVILTRANGQRIIVDCVKAAKDSTYDLPVYPGDKIEVPLRGPLDF